MSFDPQNLLKIFNRAKKLIKSMLTIMIDL